MPLPPNPIIQILADTDPPVVWLIPDFIPQGSVLALGGEPGAGKSTLCYHLGLAVAAGLSPLSLFPAQPPRRVLYFDQENSRSDRHQYIRWAWRGLGCPDPTLLHHHFYSAPMLLGGTPEHWQQWATEAILEFQPALVFFDTFNPCFSVQDENDNAEAERLIGRLRSILSFATPAPAAILIKHAKVLTEGERKRKLRGATGLEGAVDGTLFHVRSAGQPSKDPARAGLARTRVYTKKVRAFGLIHDLAITPHWLQPGQPRDHPTQGIVLAAERHEPKGESEG